MRNPDLTPFSRRSVTRQILDFLQPHKGDVASQATIAPELSPLFAQSGQNLQRFQTNSPLMPFAGRYGREVAGTTGNERLGAGLMSHMNDTPIQESMAMRALNQSVGAAGWSPTTGDPKGYDLSGGPSTYDFQGATQPYGQDWVGGPDDYAYDGAYGPDPGAPPGDPNALPNGAPELNGVEPTQHGRGNGGKSSSFATPDGMGSYADPGGGDAGGGGGSQSPDFMSGLMSMAKSYGIDPSAVSSLFSRGMGTQNATPGPMGASAQPPRITSQARDASGSAGPYGRQYVPGGHESLGMDPTPWRNQDPTQRNAESFVTDDLMQAGNRNMSQADVLAKYGAPGSDARRAYGEKLRSDYLKNNGGAGAGPSYEQWQQGIFDARTGKPQGMTAPAEGAWYKQQRGPNAGIDPLQQGAPSGVAANTGNAGTDAILEAQRRRAAAAQTSGGNPAAYGQVR